MSFLRSIIPGGFAAAALLAGAAAYAEQKPAPMPTNPGQPATTLPSTPTYTYPVAPSNVTIKEKSHKVVSEENPAPGEDKRLGAAKPNVTPAAAPAQAAAKAPGPDALKTGPASPPSTTAAIPHIVSVTHSGSYPNPTVTGVIKCHSTSTLKAFYSKKVGSTRATPTQFATFQCKPPALASGAVITVTKSTTFSPSGGVSPGDTFAVSVKEGTTLSNIVVHTF